MERQELVYKLADEVVQEFLGIMHDWLQPNDYELLEKKANEFLFEGAKRALYTISREGPKDDPALTKDTTKKGCCDECENYVERVDTNVRVPYCMNSYCPCHNGDWHLAYCPKCIQSTNHDDKGCLKCRPNGEVAKDTV